MCIRDSGRPDDGHHARFEHVLTHCHHYADVCRQAGQHDVHHFVDPQKTARTGAVSDGQGDYRMMRLETGVVMGLPLRETRIGALSSACGRRARFANAQALLAISAMPNPDSGRMAPIPIPPAGNRVPCTLSFHPRCGWRNLYFSVKPRKNANLPVFSFVYRAAINETGGSGT